MKIQLAQPQSGALSRNLLHSAAIHVGKSYFFVRANKNK